MRFTTIIYFFFLIILFSCQKSSETLNIIAWGEESNGLQLSICINDTHLTEGESGTVNLIVKNVTDEQIVHDLYSTFNFYDEEIILRYISYFDLMAEDMTNL